MQTLEPVPPQPSRGTWDQDEGRDLPAALGGALATARPSKRRRDTGSWGREFGEPSSQCHPGGGSAPRCSGLPAGLRRLQNPGPRQLPGDYPESPAQATGPGGGRQQLPLPGRGTGRKR